MQRTKHNVIPILKVIDNKPTHVTKLQLFLNRTGLRGEFEKKCKNSKMFFIKYGNNPNAISFAFPLTDEKWKQAHSKFFQYCYKVRI